MTESDICLDELYQVPRRARAGTARESAEAVRFGSALDVMRDAFEIR